MGRIVDILGGVAALTVIATFLGYRTMIRATLRTLGRKPESPPPSERRLEIVGGTETPKPPEES